MPGTPGASMSGSFAESGGLRTRGIHIPMMFLSTPVSTCTYRFVRSTQPLGCIRYGVVHVSFSKAKADALRVNLS